MNDERCGEIFPLRHGVTSFHRNSRNPSSTLDVMSTSRQSRTGTRGALATITGFGALAGVMVTAMISPALAVTSVGVNSSVGVFDALPEFIELGEQAQKNTLWATKSSDPADGYVAFAEVYWQDREEVRLQDMSPYLLGAAVAGEDRRFYEHTGVDINSVLRAALGNTVSGDIQSGASTLSMQLVKNTYIQRSQYLPTEEDRQAAYATAIESSFDRKLSEMKLAIGLEKRYSKDEILEAYLNITGFGGNTYGVQAAAQKYFGQSAKNLSPAQASSLMAIVQYPSTRNLENPGELRCEPRTTRRHPGGHAGRGLPHRGRIYGRDQHHRR